MSCHIVRRTLYGVLSRSSYIDEDYGVPYQWSSSDPPTIYTQGPYSVETQMMFKNGANS